MRTYKQCGVNEGARLNVSNYAGVFLLSVYNSKFGFYEKHMVYNKNIGGENVVLFNMENFILLSIAGLKLLIMIVKQ